MKKYLLALLVALCSVGVTCAQTTNRVRIRIGQIEIPKGFDTLNAANSTLYDNLRMGAKENDMDNYAKAAGYFKSACVGVEKIRDKNPELLSNCYYYLGVVCVNGSDNRNAEACFKKSYDIRKEALGEGNIKTIQCLTMLGLVCMNHLDFDNALKYFTPALQYYQATATKNDVKAATCYEYMGVCYEGKKQLDEAIKNYSAALQLYKTAYNDSHLVISDCLFKIGILYYKKQQYDESLNYVNQSLAMREKLLQKNDIKTAECYYQKGIINQIQKKESEAIRNFQTAYSIYKQNDMANHRVSIQSLTYLLQISMGHNNPKESLYYSALLLAAKEQNKYIDSLDMAETYANHGVLLARNKNFNDALICLHKALDIRFAKLGDSEKTRNVYHNLATTYTNFGDYPNSIVYYIKTLESYSKSKEKKQVCENYYNSDLGMAYIDNAEYDKALQCAQKIKADKAEYDPRNEESLWDYYLIASEAYRGQEKFDLAIETAQKGLNLYEKKNKNNAAELVVYNNMGKTYLAKGDYKNALDVLQMAASAFSKVMDKDSMRVALVYGNMGSVYREQGLWDKSLDYLNKALDIRVKRYGQQHILAADIYNELGLTYQAKGDTAKSAEFLNKALTIREKMLRKDHPQLADTYQGLGGLYASKGNNDKAITYYQKALAIREKAFEPTSPSLKKTYKAMSQCYLAEGDKTQADVYLEKSKVNPQ